MESKVNNREASDGTASLINWKGGLSPIGLQIIRGEVRKRPVVNGSNKSGSNSSACRNVSLPGNGAQLLKSRIGENFGRD